MTALKQLEIEYNGIYGTIEGYTSDKALMNHLEQLKKGIDEKDYESTKYSLGCIDEWYNANIYKIRSNEWVTNQDAHAQNKKLISDLYNRLDPNDFKKQSANNGVKNDMNNKIIFLSHKSNDKLYGNALRDFIIDLGVKDNQLIYTSHPLHKIPLDANIYDYLRSNINGEIFMIILWSNDYLDSPACLNEMGAAWVVQSDYTNIYVPNFSFGNPKYRECAVDTNKMGAVLNGDEHCKQSMIELKNKICEMFNLTVDEKRTTYLLDRFINELNRIKNDDLFAF